MVLREAVQQGVIKHGRREVNVASGGTTFGDVIYPWALKPGARTVVINGSGPISAHVRRWALRRGWPTLSL
jgi:hypothetical protein